MEGQLQYAHGWVGRRMHGRSYCWRPYNHVLSEHKRISYGVMDCKMIKLIMFTQLAFFFFAGIQAVSHKVICARNDGISSVLIGMPVKNLSDVDI